MHYDKYIKNNFSALLIALSLFMFVPRSVFSIDCTKATKEIEKIICSDAKLLESDKQFNDEYITIMKNLNNEEKNTFRSSTKELLKARDDCVNVYGLVTKEILTKDADAKEIDYQKGCILTFYSNATYTIKNFGKFDMPSSKDYIAFFSKVVGDILPVHYGNIEDGEGGGEINITYGFSFNKNGKWFASKSSSSDWVGSFHPNHSGQEQFFIWNAKDKNIIKLDGISTSGYSCHVPIKEPTIINNSIYLPEQIDFTKTFNEILGTYDEWQCYACTGAYKPNCLLRLQDINQKNESYLVFTNDYLESLIGEGDKPTKYNVKCVQDVIIKYADDVKEHKKKCRRYNEQDNSNNDCIFVKESMLDKIKKHISEQCFNSN